MSVRLCVCVRARTGIHVEYRVITKVHAYRHTHTHTKTHTHTHREDGGGDVSMREVDDSFFELTAADIGTKPI